MLEKTRYEDIEAQLERLSRTSRPGTFLLQVRGLAHALLDAGYEREVLLEAFERFRSVLRERNQEDLEDELLDVMD